MILIDITYKLRLAGILETLSFPTSAEYDRRNSFVIDIFDQYVAEHSERIKPVRLRTAFCGAGDDAMCSIIADSKPLYVDDDHVFEHGADLIAEETNLLM